MHPRMFGGLDAKPQRFQSLPFVWKIGERYLKGDVVNRGGCGIEPPLTGTGRPVKESQDLSMTPIAIGDLEEDSIIGTPHHFQANDFLVEALHGVQIVDPQGNLAQGLDRSLVIRHETTFFAAGIRG